MLLCPLFTREKRAEASSAIMNIKKETNIFLSVSFYAVTISPVLKCQRICIEMVIMALYDFPLIFTLSVRLFRSPMPGPQTPQLVRKPLHLGVSDGRSFSQELRYSRRPHSCVVQQLFILVSAKRSHERARLPLAYAQARVVTGTGATPRVNPA